MDSTCINGETYVREATSRRPFGLRRAGWLLAATLIVLAGIAANPGRSRAQTIVLSQTSEHHSGFLNLHFSFGRISGNFSPQLAAINFGEQFCQFGAVPDMPLSLELDMNFRDGTANGTISGDDSTTPPHFAFSESGVDPGFPQPFKKGCGLYTDAAGKMQECCAYFYTYTVHWTASGKVSGRLAPEHSQELRLEGD